MNTEIQPGEHIGTRSVSSTGQKKDQYIESWRGISILLVMAYHFTNRVAFSAMGSPVPPTVEFYSGKLGVYVFFVLSGYLISLTLGSSRSLAEFYAKRLSRIWPLLILASIVIFAFLQIFEPPRVFAGDAAKTFNTERITFPDLIATMLFLPQLGFRWVEGPFWSILVELKFYLFIGIFTALFAKNNVRNFAYASVALGILEYALYIFVGGGDHIFANKLLHGFLIAQFLPFFAIGMMMQRNLYGGLFNACLLLATMQCAIAVGANPEFDLQRLLIFMFCFAAVYIADATLAGGRLFLWFGKFSFSVYLFHQTIGVTMIKYLTPHIGIDAAIVCALISVCAIAWVASWLVEWRFRRKVTHWLIRAFGLIGLDRVRLQAEVPPARETPPVAGASALG